MKSPLVWFLFVALFALHHDVWFWGDSSLIFGFMPVGLAWHVGFSIAAGLLWLLAIKIAWPSDIEAWAEETDASAAKVSTTASK